MSAPSDRDSAAAPAGAAVPDGGSSSKIKSTNGVLAVDASRADLDRALVMRHFRGLVDSGAAHWTVMEGGHIRLSLNSGAVFDLGLTEVTRIA